MLPSIHQIQMQLIIAGNLVYRPLSFDHLQRDLGLCGYLMRQGIIGTVAVIA
jgi:hypothetical protein